MDQYRTLSDHANSYFEQMEAYQMDGMIPMRFMQVIRSLIMFQGMDEESKWKLAKIHIDYWMGPKFMGKYNDTVSCFSQDYPDIFKPVDLSQPYVKPTLPYPKHFDTHV